MDLCANFAHEITTDTHAYYGNFCFSNWQQYDLVINGKKIGGNAQRRKRNIIFQHGSIPQKLDFYRLSKTIRGCEDAFVRSASLESLLKVPVDFRYLQKLLINSFKDTFNIDFTEQGLSRFQEHLCQDLLNTKYIQDSWNFKNEKTTMAQ